MMRTTPSPSASMAVQIATRVTLQLHGDDAPQCLETTLTNISKQLPTVFRAKQ